jgi:AraC-like DNA-binding protein
MLQAASTSFATNGQTYPSQHRYLSVVHPASSPRIPFKERFSGTEHDLKARIDTFIDGDMPFLRPGFTLTDMANETGVPRHVLSHFINKEYGMNFNSLINGFRVGYLKSIPGQDPDWRRLTLEALGRKAGFNSRNTLIKAFKKCTGECPSEFFARASQGSNFSFSGSLMKQTNSN